jgi:hypothetical protein
MLRLGVVGARGARARLHPPRVATAVQRRARWCACG